MLLGKTVAYNPLLHDNTVNYTGPHVLHMLYARSHPDAIAPSLSLTLPVFLFFLKTQLTIQLRHLISTAAPVPCARLRLFCNGFVYSLLFIPT